MINKPMRYISPFLLIHTIFLHALKTKLKITQLEKVHFIKVNELKQTQVQLF